MENLRVLGLLDNNFTGTIPTELGALTHKLAQLEAIGNALTGTIPSELGQLPLWRMHLEGNPLRGTIPTELGLLTRMEELKLNQTNLTGTVPEEVCALTRGNLTTFTLNSDKVYCPANCGCIPTGTAAAATARVGGA